MIWSLTTPLPPDTIMATVDVSSLYTSISHTHGLSALEYFLNQCPPHTLPSTQFLIQLTQFILTHNNFSFDSHHLLQVKGTAMFMVHLEQDFLDSQLDKPKLWLRFIDDIFLLWPHGSDSHSAFLEQLNSRYPVHFTWNTSPLPRHLSGCQCLYRPWSILYLCPS